MKEWEVVMSSLISVPLKEGIDTEKGIHISPVKGKPMTWMARWMCFYGLLTAVFFVIIIIYSNYMNRPLPIPVILSLSVPFIVLSIAILIFIFF